MKVAVVNDKFIAIYPSMHVCSAFLCSRMTHIFCNLRVHISVKELIVIHVCILLSESHFLLIFYRSSTVIGHVFYKLCCHRLQRYLNVRTNYIELQQ